MRGALGRPRRRSPSQSRWHCRCSLACQQSLGAQGAPLQAVFGPCAARWCCPKRSAWLAPQPPDVLPIRMPAAAMQCRGAAAASEQQLHAAAAATASAAAHLAHGGAAAAVSNLLHLARPLRGLPSPSAFCFMLRLRPAQDAAAARSRPPPAHRARVRQRPDAALRAALRCSAAAPLLLPRTCACRLPLPLRLTAVRLVLHAPATARRLPLLLRPASAPAAGPRLMLRPTSSVPPASSCCCCVCVVAPATTTTAAAALSLPRPALVFLSRLALAPRSPFRVAPRRCCARAARHGRRGPARPAGRRRRRHAPPARVRRECAVGAGRAALQLTRTLLAHPHAASARCSWRSPACRRAGGEHAHARTHAAAPAS